MTTTSKDLAEALVRRHPSLGAADAHDEGLLHCHELVELALRLPEARGLRRVDWDESKWTEVSRVLRDERAGWPKFETRPPRELLVDVADGSVNGHSFLVDRAGRAVDPYMALRHVPDYDIAKLGMYLRGVYRRAGMRVPAARRRA